MNIPTPRLAAAVLTVLALAGCSDAGDLSDLGPRTAPGTVTVGSADGAVSRVTALIYANALSGTGEVRTRLGLGPGDAAVAAVERGEITMAPALTGALWERFRPGAAQPSPLAGQDAARGQWGAQFTALSAVLPEGLGLGDPTSALDQPMLFTGAGAPAASLRGCVGLTGPVAIAAGAPSDLRARYGCPTGPVIVEPDEAHAAQAVLQGRATLAQLGTLSPAARGLTQVADPDATVPARAVVPLVRRDGLTAAQTKRLSAVAGELTTADLATMVAKVESGERSAEQVAADWAADHPLH